MGAELLAEGLVVPAHPLALTAERRLDERRQRALTRYYLAAGAGGIAIAVHTTQFEIHEPDRGLLEPVLALTADVLDREADRDLVRIAGVVGPTAQAVAEAELAARLGYDAVLLSPRLAGATEDALIERARAVGEVLPVIGFYLQEAIGGPVLSRDFWRRFADLTAVVAVKAAPFDRYRTIELVRGVGESDRASDVALYTGNDDAIVADLTAVHRVQTATGTRELRFRGGLLGQWAVGTRAATGVLALAKRAQAGDAAAALELADLAADLTDLNAAVFDPANGFAGVIAGVHEVLRQQGLLEGIWCLDPEETLSPGQAAEIERVRLAYPRLSDDAFIAEHRDEWLR
ncbi:MULTISPECIES: dihydrodipicolinate synthase family protein [Leifsonia]|uniref:Dihydrodipicolinate synthase/N-acetylneuraminate lyase n=4 Tax=Leifsonia TaxID=110932 RepID=A0A7W4YHL6_LEIAQ|nr:MULTISPECIES: dihydrodipicolinate synthase family protein [Leifsonia]MBB2966066.1 dihydrodipicolinate synthase/N-acetylneuraminate lyase [Leifsonia aquatica]NYK12186.1 dihydrodipicolinate synthase/N-acetylneuraminate lyase [Leifsonia naganoensis]